MSALGQKRKFARQFAMSALPPKADLMSPLRNVRFVPEADIQLNRLMSGLSLFDQIDLVTLKII